MSCGADEEHTSSPSMHSDGTLYGMYVTSDIVQFLDMLVYKTDKGLILRLQDTVESGFYVVILLFVARALLPVQP